MHHLDKLLALVFALGLHVAPAFVAADTTVISFNSFSSVSTFESFCSYLYPWGSDHNGSARMKGSSTDHSHIQVNVASNTLTLIATPTSNASPPTSAANPHPAIHYASLKLRLLKLRDTLSPASSVPPADVRIDFFMDNTLRSTQFGKGFVGKALWLIINLQMEGSSGSPGPTGTTTYKARNVVVTRDD